MMLESGCGVVRSGGMGVVLVLGNHFARFPANSGEGSSDPASVLRVE